MTNKENNNFWRQRYFELLDSLKPIKTSFGERIETLGILNYLEETKPRKGKNK